MRGAWRECLAAESKCKQFPRTQTGEVMNGSDACSQRGAVSGQSRHPHAMADFVPSFRPDITWMGSSATGGGRAHRSRRCRPMRAASRPITKRVVPGHENNAMSPTACTRPDLGRLHRTQALGLGSVQMELRRSLTRSRCAPTGITWSNCRLVDCTSDRCRCT